MTSDEYRHALYAVFVAGGLLEVQDIEGMIAAIDKADTLGPVLDPTLWMKNNKKMQADREMLVAALPLAALMKKRRENSEKSG